MQANKAKQAGAILYTTLFVLLVITVLAASAITITSSGQRAATNTYASDMTFVASESAINAAIGNDNALLQAVATGSEELDVDLENPAITSTASIDLVGTSAATGFSLGVESGSFAAYQFEITGTGEMTSITSKSETVQGLYKIAPGG